MSSERSGSRAARVYDGGHVATASSTTCGATSRRSPSAAVHRAASSNSRAAGDSTLTPARSSRASEARCIASMASSGQIWIMQSGIGCRPRSPSDARPRAPPKSRALDGSGAPPEPDEPQDEAEGRGSDGRGSGAAAEHLLVGGRKVDDGVDVAGPVVLDHRVGVLRDHVVDLIQSRGAAEFLRVLIARLELNGFMPS